MNTKLGFIGIGNMGYGMVKNLLLHGFSVLAFDIDQEKLDLVVMLGAEKAKGIQEIGDTVETVILALPHPDISKQVILELLKGNGIKTIIETSTLTPEDSLLFASELAEHKIHYLCAPMLAGKQMALDGNIHFIVEGEQSTFEQYKDVFASMGNAQYMGEVPNATVAKLAYNVCRYSNVATALTVIQFLRQYTKNLEPIYNVLAEGSLDNFGQVWKEEMKDVALENKPYKFAGSKIPIKDLSLVMNMALAKGLPIEIYENIKKVYESMADA